MQSVAPDELDIEKLVPIMQSLQSRKHVSLKASKQKVEVKSTWLHQSDFNEYNYHSIIKFRKLNTDKIYFSDEYTVDKAYKSAMAMNYELLDRTFRPNHKVKIDQAPLA